MALVVEGVALHICYIDESGSSERFTPSIVESTPVFALVGVSVPHLRQKDLIWQFLQLKKEFEPQLTKPGKRLSDVVRHEVKGSRLRKDVRAEGSRNRRRRAIGFVDKTLGLLESNDCRLMGKVLVKSPNSDYVDAATYGAAIRDLACTFNRQLDGCDSQGIMLLDARTKSKNEGNVHVVTTGRFKSGGDQYPHLVEAPTFGHSDTHVPLQIADIVASAVVFPLACTAYCSSHTWSTHVHHRFEDLRDRFGPRLARLQYRYSDESGARHGGFKVVGAGSARQSGRLLFGADSPIQGQATA